jgi:outer membrane lipoprotein-sorting protein
MRLSNLRKFFPVIGLVLLSLPACRFWQTADKPATLTGEAANELPFSTKIPGIFQTRVVVTAGTVTQKYFIAQAGDEWRIDYSAGEPDEVSIIYNGVEYYVSFPKKICAEKPLNQGETAAPDDVMSDLLYHAPTANFEKTGRENNITMYRVKFGDAASSEAFIYVNEDIGIPVKQEFYSINGDQRTLEYTVEFQDLKLTAEDDLFKIPDGFKKVPVQDFLQKQGE